MKLLKNVLLFATCIALSATIHAQSDSDKGTFWKPNPPNYKVKQAFEVESLVPMFLYGGYHIGLGYRYERFRVRVSVINGGDYNAEKAGISNSYPEYKRYYKTSPGLFLGCNVWKNLEVYGYLEHHTFETEQMATNEKQQLVSNDVGLGISYQAFIGKTFYIQPGIHSYFRDKQSLTFSDNSTYTIPAVDLSVVVRVGVRLWEKY